MTNTESEPHAITLPAIHATSGARNPHVVMLAIVGGLSWFMAFILWLTRAQIVDYTIYDVDDAAALAWWIDTLVFTGVATALAAAVIVGVRHELRWADRH